MPQHPGRQTLVTTCAFGSNLSIIAAVWRILPMTQAYRRFPLVLVGNKTETYRVQNRENKSTVPRTATKGHNRAGCTAPAEREARGWPASDLALRYAMSGTG